MDGPTTRLRLRVSPGARRSEIVGRHGDGWKVRVAAAPERGRANDAVLDELARALGVGRSDVELLAGQGSRDKVLVVHGISEVEAEARLEAACSPARAGAR